MLRKIIVFFAILRLARVVTADNVNCGAGQFDDLVTGSCQQCPDGTYMTAEMAAKGGQNACALCHRPDAEAYEILAEPCTKSKDALILCDESHYRKNGSSPEDSKCTPCGICGVGTNGGLPYLKAHCYNYTDTVCCENDDMVVENGKCLRPTPFHPRQAVNMITIGSTNRTTEYMMTTTENNIKQNEDPPRTTDHIPRNQRNNGVVPVSNRQIALETFLSCLFVIFLVRGYHPLI